MRCQVLRGAGLGGSCGGGRGALGAPRSGMRNTGLPNGLGGLRLERKDENPDGTIPRKGM